MTKEEKGKLRQEIANLYQHKREILKMVLRREIDSKEYKRRTIEVEDRIAEKRKLLAK